MLAASLLLAPPASAAPGFQILIEPPSQLLPPGGSVSFQVRLGAIDGFDEPVTLTVGELPQGVESVLSHEVVTPPGTSTLTLIAAEDAATGSFDLVVTGTGGGITNIATSSVTVDFGLVPVCYGYVKGTVTDAETGAPIGGATVYGDSVTDSNGHWGPVQVQLGENNSPITVLVAAQKNAYWDASQLATAICDQTTEVDLALLPWHPAAIVGSVVEGAPDVADPTIVIPIGPPLDGVAISTQFYPPPTGGGSATSALNGSYRIDLPHVDHNNEPATGLYLRAVLDGYWARDFGSPSPIAIGDLAADEEMAVDPFGMVRQCTGSISGTAVYADTGEPAVGLTVTASHQWEAEQTETDALGAFSFPAVLLGYNNQPVEFGVFVNGTDFHFGDSKLAPIDTCDESASVQLVLTPKAFGDLEGYVVDEETGEPVAGVLVGPIGGCGPCTIDLATTNADGYYRIDEMPADFAPSVYSIITSHPDYWQSGGEVEIMAGQTARLDLEILQRRFAHVTGEVVDAIDGSPIEGATIGFPSPVLTDQSGHYVSGPLMVGNRNAPLDAAFQAGAAGYWPQEQMVTLRADETAELDYQLIPICEGALVRGTVVDAVTKEPIPNALVSATGGGSDLTNEVGAYFIEGISVGNNNTPIEVLITASAEGYHSQSRTITVFCGGSFTIEFGPEPPTSALEGFITCDGAPLANVFVGSEFGPSTVSDADGHYTFVDVPLNADGSSRTWLITADPEEYPSRTEAVTVVADLTARLDFEFCAVPQGSFSLWKQANGAGEWTFDVQGTYDNCIGETDFVLADNQSVTCGAQPGDLITITELDPGDGSVLVDINCQGAPNADIDLASRSVTITVLEQSTLCFFINDVQPEPLPSLTVVKVASPDSVKESGGIVTFEITITNTSSPTDPITIVSLRDEIWYDVNGNRQRDAGELVTLDITDAGDPNLIDTTCDTLLGTAIQPSASVSCEFTLRVAGNPWEDPVDTASVTGRDDEGVEAGGSGDAQVDIQQINRRSIDVAGMTASRSTDRTVVSGLFMITNQSDPGVDALIETLDLTFQQMSGKRWISINPDLYGCRFWLDDGDLVIDSGDIRSDPANAGVVLDESATILYECTRSTGMWPDRLRITAHVAIDGRDKEFRFTKTFSFAS